MIKATFYLSILFVTLLTLFPNCKGNQSEKIEMLMQDSVKKTDSINQLKPINEYATVPPDPEYSGDYVDKYNNGIIKFIGTFRFGKRHGQWMAFYDSGIKWSECYYDKGKKHGESTVYFPNGKLHYRGWFKNDLRDSLWFFYDENGKETDKRAFRNDSETGLVN